MCDQALSVARDGPQNAHKAHNVDRQREQDQKGHDGRSRNQIGGCAQQAYITRHSSATQEDGQCYLPAERDQKFEQP